MSSRRTSSCLPSRSSSSWRTRSRSAASPAEQMRPARARSAPGGARRPRRPHRQPALDQRPRSAVERGAVARRSRCAGGSPPPPASARRARVDIVGRLDQRGRRAVRAAGRSRGSRPSRRRRPAPPAPSAGDSGTKLIWRSTTSALGTSTSPAQADSPDSAAVVARERPPRRRRVPTLRLDRARARPRSARAPASCRRRTAAGPVRSATARPSVCGAASSPSSSRSCMTLRIDAGDSPSSRQLRQGPRPDRRAGLEIPLDHRAEDVARAVVEFGDGGRLMAAM